MVLGDLAPLDVISIKFVSRAAYLKTKHPDGQEIFDLTGGVPHRSYSEFMVKLEAEGLQCRSLLCLTCGSCGAQKANDRHGFNDSEFRQDHLMRQCIQCTPEFRYILSSFRARGEHMFFCGFKSCVRPLEQKVSQSEKSLISSSFRIVMNDPPNKLKFSIAQRQTLHFGGDMCIHCLQSCMKRLRKWPRLNRGRCTKPVRAFRSNLEMLDKSLLRCSDL